MNRKGVLLIISGFSGAGKGTVVKEMLNQYDNYALSISATTRKPREGEQEGVSYFFKTTDMFEQMIQENRFIEYARYVDNYYGTPRDYVEQKMEEGYDVILEIELQGALKVREQYPDAVLIFVTSPSAQELENRLCGRGTEDAATIAKRMARASEEAPYMKKYNYVVVNETVPECAAAIHGIVQAEHARASMNDAFIEQIQQQLKAYAKGE